VSGRGRIAGLRIASRRAGRLVKDKRRPPANDDGRGCRRPAGRVVCRDVSGDAYLVELWVDGTRP